MKNFKNAVALALGLTLGAVTTAQAAAVDVTAVVTDIGAQSSSIVAIGGAVLLLIVGIKSFKWVRRAM